MQYEKMHTSGYPTLRDYYKPQNYGTSCANGNPGGCCNSCNCTPGCPDNCGTANKQVGIQVQLQGSEGVGLNNLQTVVFNRVLFQQNPCINYNAATGEFQINRPGNYFITWWVSVNGTDLGTKVAFSLLINGQNAIVGESPLVTGQVNGSGLISTMQPAIIKLVNSSNDRIYYGNVDVQANLIIIDLN